ncbi:MAG: hypothetical protein WBA93_19910 [Microcoleaceae cyanobacterium]
MAFALFWLPNDNYAIIAQYDIIRNVAEMSMADDRRRITTDSFNPALLELVQNFALINSQNEGEFCRNLVQQYTYEADENGNIDSGLEQLAKYCDMELETLEKWIKVKRKEGMSNSQILNAIEELTKTREK